MHIYIYINCIYTIYICSQKYSVKLGHNCTIAPIQYHPLNGNVYFVCNRPVNSGRPRLCKTWWRHAIFIYLFSPLFTKRVYVILPYVYATTYRLRNVWFFQNLPNTRSHSFESSWNLLVNMKELELRYGYPCSSISLKLIFFHSWSDLRFQHFSSWCSILMCNKSTSAGTSLEGTPMFAPVTLHRTFNPQGRKCPWWQNVEAAS